VTGTSRVVLLLLGLLLLLVVDWIALQKVNSLDWRVSAYLARCLIGFHPVEQLLNVKVVLILVSRTHILILSLFQRHWVVRLRYSFLVHTRLRNQKWLLGLDSTMHHEVIILLLGHHMMLSWLIRHVLMHRYVVFIGHEVDLGVRLRRDHSLLLVLNFLEVGKNVLIARIGVALSIELVYHQAFLVNRCSIVALSRNHNRLLLSWGWDHIGLRYGCASSRFRMVASHGLNALWLGPAAGSPSFTSSVKCCLLWHRSCCRRSRDQSCVWIIWITHRWLLQTGWDNRINIATIALLRPGSLVVEVPIRHCSFTRDLVLMEKLLLSYYAVWLRLLHHRCLLHIGWSCLLPWRCPRVLLDRSLGLACRLDFGCLVWLLQKHLLLRYHYSLAWNRSLGNSVVKSVSSCVSSLIDGLGFVFASTRWCDIAWSVEDNILTGKHCVKLLNLLDLTGVHVLIRCRYNCCTGHDYLLDQLLRLLLTVFSNMLHLGAPTALKFLHDHVGIVTQLLFLSCSFTVDTVFVSTDLALDKGVISFSAGLSVPLPTTCSVLLVFGVAGAASWIHHYRQSVPTFERRTLLFVTSDAPPIGWVSIWSWFVMVLGWVSVVRLSHLGVLVLESLITTLLLLLLLLNLLWILKNCRNHLLLPQLGFLYRNLADEPGSWIDLRGLNSY